VDKFWWLEPVHYEDQDLGIDGFRGLPMADQWPGPPVRLMDDDVTGGVAAHLQAAPRPPVARAHDAAILDRVVDAGLTGLDPVPLHPGVAPRRSAAPIACYRAADDLGVVMPLHLDGVAWPQLHGAKLRRTPAAAL